MPCVGAHALSDLQYILINAEKVDQLLGWRQQLIELVDSRPELMRLVDACQNARALQQLPLENMRAVLEKFMPMCVMADEYIVTQGEKGDAYYIIERGQAEVYQTDPFTHQSRLVNKLGPGDCFGEEALVQEGCRSASVKMVTPGVLYVLPSIDFNHEINADQAFELIQQNKATWLDCRYEMEYEEARIPNAKLIPLDRMRWDTHKLDANRKYIVYCRSGRRSKVASFLLRERNIEAFSLVGGIKDWPYAIDAQPLFHEKIVAAR
jgi:rhodanese-related sulfurtransferase